MMKLQKSRNWRLINISAVFALVALWVSIPALTSIVKADGEEPVSLEALSSIRRTASLSAPGGATNPNGLAEWELDDDGEREIEIEVYGLALAQGTLVTSVVNGNAIGQSAINCGMTTLRLRTDDGQAVPVVNNGSTVEVRNGSTVLVSGVFGIGPSPSPSGSPSGSPSPTASPSPCGTASPSPSGTASPSPSGTASPSPSGTASPSPSGTASPSPSGTASPSPSGTASPSPSGTASPSPSGTASPSPSGTASPSPSPNSGDLFAGLTGPTLNGVLPSGFAQYELHSSRTELEVRTRQVYLTIGTALTVVVNGNSVGTMFVESGGEGRLRLRSDEGQFVPVVAAGMPVAIRNGSATILSGTFTSAFGTPSPSPSASPSPSGSPSGSPTGSPSPSPSGTASPSPSGSPSPSPSGTASPTPSFGRSFEANLTGSGVSPTVNTPATGEIKVSLNASETQATVFGEFHNLTSNQTAARIETAVGTVFTIRDLGVVGGRNGNFASVTFSVTAAQVQQLRAGLWSAVIASVNHPNGEIRSSFRQRGGESDLNGDGISDFAIFRPSTGVWWISNSEGISTQVLGSGSDKVVSGDYDGDGKTDVGLFRNVGGLGIWEIKRSSDGGLTSVQWGFASDIPVRGDFDGDGRLDITIYRPSNGAWYILKSDNTGFSIFNWGIAEDIPVTADMDGDGKDDVAVFRPSTGVWYWIRSSDSGFAGVAWGLNGDIATPADFDGDGKSDVAVFRPSTGAWYWMRSSDQTFSAATWGMDGDIPVTGDYDADGKADIAVFRPSDGNWYVLRSSDLGFNIYNFGMIGDVPLVAR